MKENQEYIVHWRKFVTFTFIIGLIVAIFSVISDNLSFLVDGVTVLEFVIAYLAVMINSLPMWFIVAMLVGYIFARNIKKAALLGAIYTITAITFYFVIGHFYTDIPVTVTISFKELAMTYVNWYGASTNGGILGGVVGYLVKKTPFALLSLLVGLILQLFVNGTSSWGDIVGIVQNVTYCLMIVSIFIYLVIVKRNDRSQYFGM
ncbi:hypothetical protein [Peribacillus frigoritolerans]|uniref:hypothetical protein n=1 Tax=Peribacillus frigoritolerans TaxID=450367 RepID=UPI0023DC20C5|nr:hypothetical protein [Peribacillus frigoritolerans]MDF1997879.1 hypothetical protein [Peribacillus frigoritolerans]